MKKKAIFVVSLCIATSLGVSAKEWTLQECINYAVEHNISVKQGELNVRNGELQVEDASHAFLPQVSASSSQSFNFGRGLTSQNTYANRNTQSFSWGASASVPIFSGMRNSRTLEQARLNLRQITWQLEQTRENVTLNVIALYLQVLYAHEVTLTAENQVQLSEFELTRRSELASAGRIAEVEVLEAEAQLAKDRLSLINAQNDYNQTLLDLAQTLRLDTSEGFSVAPIEGVTPKLPDFQNVFNAALDCNSGLKAANAAIDVAEAGIGVAKTGYLPTLSFSAGTGSSYFKLNGVDNPAFRNQMRDNFSTYLGFSLNIPVFDAFNTRNAVRRARVQHLSAQLQADQAKDDLYKAIQQAHMQASGARDKYMTSIVSCDAAKASFDAMVERYNMGSVTSTEYEQSKTNYFSAKVQRIQAHYEYLLRYRILQFYQGYKD